MPHKKKRAWKRKEAKEEKSEVENVDQPKKEEDSNKSSEEVEKPRQSPATASSDKPSDSSELADVLEDGTNSKTILCQFCPCKILLPEKGNYEQKTVFYHSLRKVRDGDASGEELTDHWVVQDMYTFENIGVTRDVSPDFKYLSCADCEIGPVGIVYTKEPQTFYLAHKRLRYE